MAGQLQSAIVEIRNVFDLFMSLRTINQNQSPGCVIECLEKFFGNGNRNRSMFTSGDETQIKVMENLQTAYQVYQKLAILCPGSAPNTLIEALDAILKSSKLAKVETENWNGDNNDENCQHNDDDDSPSVFDGALVRSEEEVRETLPSTSSIHNQRDQGESNAMEIAHEIYGEDKQESSSMDGSIGNIGDVGGGEQLVQNNEMEIVEHDSRVKVRQLRRQSPDILKVVGRKSIKRGKTATATPSSSRSITEAETKNTRSQRKIKPEPSEPAKLLKRKVLSPLELQQLRAKQQAKIDKKKKKITEFPCNICRRQRDSTDLKRHYFIYHSTDFVAQYICGCNRMYSSWDDMKVHRRGGKKTKGGKKTEPCPYEIPKSTEQVDKNYEAASVPDLPALKDDEEDEEHEDEEEDEEHEEEDED